MLTDVAGKLMKWRYRRKMERRRMKKIKMMIFGEDNRMMKMEKSVKAIDGRDL